MLKLYNKEHVAVAALTDLKDHKIEYVLSGEDLKEFSLSIVDENISLVEEECYVRDKDNEYVIKAMDPSQSYKRFNCIVNVESIKGKAIANFNTSNNSITDTIRLAIAGTGWILADNNITKRRTVRLKNTNALEVLREVRKVFRVDFRFDAINKIIYVYEKFGTDKGVYFSDELNLISLDIPSDTFDYITRIIPKGKDDLDIKSINNGKDYIENSQYSNKIIEYIWEDNRYTVVENLKEDALAKLEELSKPKRSYQANLADLAKMSDEYKFLDFFLGDTITLLSKTEKFRDKQRIVKYIEYPDDPSKNTCELGNTTLSFEDLQQENEYKNQVLDNITTDNDTLDGSKVDGIKAEQIYDFESSVAKITDLTVINAKIYSLEAHNVSITGRLNAVEATIGTLEANVATIDKLTVTHTALINDLQANKASITQLEAINANIKILEADVGNIETLVNGNLSSKNLQAGSITARELAANSITAGSTVIGEGAIGNAQISNLDATKLNAGTIDTSLITIAGPNSNLKLKGNRLQVFVGIGNNQVERVSLGDIFGDGSKYGFLVRGADGKTVIMDENGVKSEGITNGSITNDKINSNANIDGAKLNINSVVTKINGATTSILGTKIDINGTNLSLKLSQQDTTITEHKKTIDSHTTSIEANTNAINLKVDNQTYISDKTNFTNTLNKATSDISLLQGQISLKVEQSDITNAIANMEIGSANLVNNSAILQNLFSPINTYKGTRTVLNDSAALSNKCVKFECTSGGTGFHMPLFPKTTEKIGNIYTWSLWAKCSVVKSGNVGHESGGQKNITITTEWKRFEYTWKFTDSQYSSFTFYQGWNTGEILYIRDFQIVKGNKVGDWTPSITDIQNDIDTKVSTAKAEINITTDAISQNLSSLTTTVNNKADGSLVTSLNNKVSNLETSLNGIKGEVSSLETTTTTINTKADKAQADATKGINDAKTATDKANNAQSTANTNKGNITNLTTEVTTVKSSVATLDVNLKGITQRVSSTESTTTSLTTQINQVDDKINNAKNQAINDSKAYINTEITKTNNKVSSIESTLSSITSRVSNVETTTSTINGQISNLSTRMNVAEQKITDASIVSIVSSQFYTKGQTDNLYASKSQLTQTDNKFQFQITQSGNPNYVLNSNFMKAFKHWEKYNDNYISYSLSGWNIPTGSGVYIVGQGDKSIYVKQTVKVPPKADTYHASAYLTCNKFLNIGGRPEESLWHFYVVLRYTDGTGETKKVPCWSNTHEQGIWKRQSVEFTRNPSKTVQSIDTYLYVRYVQGNFYMGMCKVETDQLTAWCTSQSELNSGIVEIDGQGISVLHTDGSTSKFTANDLQFTNENGKKKMAIKRGGLAVYNHQSGLFLGLDSSTQFSDEFSKFGMQKFASKHCSFYDILYSPTTENDDNLKVANSIFRICFENLDSPTNWRTVKGIHSYDKHRFHEGIDLMMKDISSCGTIFVSNKDTRRKITFDDNYNELQIGFSSGGLIIGQTKSDGSVETGIKVYEKFYMDIYRSCNFQGNEITNAIIRTNYSLMGTSPGRSVGADTASIETMLLQEDFSEYDEKTNSVVVNLNEALKSVYGKNKELENENEILKNENNNLNKELETTKNALDVILMNVV